MSNSYRTGFEGEHHFRKVIPGNIDEVRQRLSDALEEFDYIVLSDSPLQAKRPARRSVMTANVLEYDTNLTIALRAITPTTTQATFDYHVSYLFSKAERLALEREGDAIIALATAPLNKTICPSCNSEHNGAVRFCRVCGAAVARNRLPAEMEVMRLMAGTSASQIEMNWGLFTLLLTLLITLPIIFFGNAKGGWILFAIGTILSVFFLLAGMSRLHETLNPKTPPQESANPTQPIILTQEKAALPAAPVSVTEGTTTLMNQPEAVPVARAKDTGSME